MAVSGDWHLCISKSAKILKDRMKSREKFLCHYGPEMAIGPHVPHISGLIPGQYQAKTLPQNISMSKCLLRQFLIGEHLLLEDSHGTLRGTCLWRKR